MEKQELKDSVLQHLRSVTISSKGGVPLDSLQRDYQALVGTHIPFKELGYTSIERFLEDIPHVINLRRNRTGLVAEAVPDESTAHIASLVSRQKESSTRRIGRGVRRLPVHSARRGFPSQYSSRGNFRPVSHSSFRSSPQISVNSYKKKNSFENSSSSTNSLSGSYEHRQRELPPRFRRLQEVRSNQLSLESAEISPSDVTKSINANEEYPCIAKPHPVTNFSMNAGKSVQLNALESAKSAKEFVDIYAGMNNIKAEYRTRTIGQKKKGIISSLILGEKTYNSYPDISYSDEEAEEAAAKKAMEFIKESKEHLSMFPETTAKSNEEIQALLFRIEEIVCEKPSGMFTNGIIIEYEKKFNETLPQNWLDLLKLSNRLDMEALDKNYGKLPKGVNVIVRPSKELSSGSITPSSTSSKTEFRTAHLDTQILSDSLHSISIKIPLITIPDGNMWDLYVSTINGFLAARFVDYSNEFLSLSEKMKQFYQSRQSPVCTVIENKLYAGYDANDDGDWWHRVLAVEVNDDDEQVQCYFVDEGEFGMLKKINLQEISPEFQCLPYQAIRISLENLEDYENWIKYQDLREILGRTFVAEVKRCWVADDFLPNCPGILRKVFSVTLYDTSCEEEPLNINEWLKSTVFDSLNCALPKISTSTCAYLSHVTPSGLIYLRFTRPENCWIEHQLQKLTPSFEVSSREALTLPLDTLCAAKSTDGKWHRAVISKHLSDSNKVQVFFTDYGTTGVVKTYDVCELKPVSAQLSFLPSQTVLCELYDVLPEPGAKWTQAATDKLLELAPFSEEIIIRVFSEGDKENLPKVNLYKRNQESFIISINHTLACSAELFEKKREETKSSLTLEKYHQNSHSKAPSNMDSLAQFSVTRKESSPTVDHIDWIVTPDNVKSPDGFEVQSSPLTLPDIPEKGFFDVFVTMAAHPCHFTVQPFATIHEMNTLSQRMQQFYSSEENSTEMHLSLLKEKEYYAALHKDGTWYRVRLEKIIPSDPPMATVYFVDFGDFSTILMTEVQPLYQEFRKLPCQAIKASLAGVRPIEKDWDPVQCVEFKEIVTEKAFVSDIQSKKLVHRNGVASIELELSLIDTSAPRQDIYIRDLLISRKLAAASH